MRANARLSRWLAPVVAGVLAGCQTLGLEPPGRQGVSAAVGDNLVGEPCRLVSASDQPIAGAQEAYTVRCGKWEQPSGRIVRVAAAASPEQQAVSSPWRDRLNSFAVCEPPVATTILDGVPAIALDCALQRGGWPYQALAAEIDGSTYLGAGIPAAMPAVERAMGHVSGRGAQIEAAPSAQGSAEIARLQVKLSNSFYSVGDLQRYQDLLRLAQYYNYRGDHAEAEKRYREALALQQQVVAADPGGQAFTVMHLALELSNQERFAEAEAFFKQADTLVTTSLEPTDEARLLSYRAIHLANQGKDSEAASLARQATSARLVLAKEYGLEQSAAPLTVAPAFAGGTRSSAPMLASRSSTALGDIVQSKYVEGAMLVRDGRLGDADRVLSEAVGIFDQDARVPRRWLPQIQLLQAEIAERQQKLAAAERLLQSTINAQRGLFTGSRTEATALIALGRVRSAQGRNTEALASFREGFAIARAAEADLRFEHVAPYFHVALAEAARDPKQRQGLFAEMFVVGQMIRGSVTAQTLALTAARLAASEQRVGLLIRDLQDARRKRDTANERLTLAQADPNTLPQQLQALDKEFQSIGAQVAELEREVQAAAPRYNQILDSPVEAQQVIEALEPNEALVQVLLGPSSALGFLIDQDGIEAYPIKLTEAQAGQIVKQLRAPFEASKFEPYNIALAYDLFSRLFGPARARLEKAEHIIYVPNGPLLSLPASVLVEEAPQAEQAPADYSKVAWLVRKHAVTLTTSVQSFFNLRSTSVASRAPSPFLGFGDFVPDRDVDAVLTTRGLPEGCRKDVMTVAKAPALPNTADELRAVAQALGTSERIVLANAFSEEGVKAARLDQYGIIYFATHGLLPHELNCWNEPSLVTSKPPAEKGDGLLTSSEIIELKLDADLVVLSACNTGGPGTDTGGESLSGLARAFFYAGARSMLVTHWRIPDEPTIRLMVSTFQIIGTGAAPVEALRRSQLLSIADADSAHPLNWAAFTVVGDGGRAFQPMARDKRIAFDDRGHALFTPAMMFSGGLLNVGALAN